MIALGTHPRVIQRRAGHATIRTTFDIYGSVLPELDEAVATGLDDVVSGSGVGLGCRARVSRPGTRATVGPRYLGDGLNL